MNEATHVIDNIDENKPFIPYTLPSGHRIGSDLYDKLNALPYKVGEENLVPIDLIGEALCLGKMWAEDDKWKFQENLIDFDVTPMEIWHNFDIPGEPQTTIAISFKNRVEAKYLKRELKIYLGGNWPNATAPWFDNFLLLKVEDVEKATLTKITEEEEQNIPEAVKKFNRTHAIINDNGRATVIEEAFDPLSQTKERVKSSFEDFAKLNSHLQVKVGEKKKVTKQKDGTETLEFYDVYENPAKIFLKHPNSRRYTGWCMDPSGKHVGGRYNLFDGFGVKAVQGPWQKIKNHFMEVLADGNLEVYEWLLDYHADMLQNPGKPGKVLIAFRGEKGTGKSSHGIILGKLLGKHCVKISHENHLTTNFNAHLEHAIAVIVEEGFWANNKKGESIIKDYITSPRIRIERKGRDSYEVANYCHFFMNTNSDWAVNASEDERRYAVFDVSNKYRGNKEYFDELYAEIENGGLSGFLYEMINRDISSFNVNKIPKTEALADQKLLSLRGAQSWLYHCLIEGRIGYCSWEEEGPEIPANDAYIDYSAFSKKVRNEYRPEDVRAFGKSVHKTLGDDLIKITRPWSKVETTRKRYWKFGSLEQCRKAFERRFGLNNFNWEIGDETTLDCRKKIGPKADCEDILR